MRHEDIRAEIARYPIETLALFAISTVRSKLHVVKSALTDAASGEGILSPWFVTAQNRGIQDFDAHQWKKHPWVRWYTVKAIHDGSFRGLGLDSLTLENKMRVLSGIKGLGTAKSAFILQLMGEDIGCIDSINRARWGLSAVPTDASEYVKVFRSQGVSEDQVWLEWCAIVAERDGWESTEAVDLAHLDCVKLCHRILREGGYVDSDL